MAPRRNHSNHHTGSVVDVHNLIGFNVGVIGDQQQQQQQHQQTQQDHFNNNNNSFESTVQIMSLSGNLNGGKGGLNETYTRCCVPVGECLMADPLSDVGLISMESLGECVRVICNNENCSAGQYMHRECFEAWEQTILNSLKSTGRARSWSDRQRAQNLWTKKGYDLVYKQCGCKCSRGHLRKDLDWSPPINNNVFGRIDEEATKKKKKRNRNNQKQILTISTINPGVYHPNSQTNHMTANNNNNGVIINNGSNDLRGRASSLSSSNGTTSPPFSGSSEHSISPIHHNNNNNMIINTNNNNNNNNNNINNNNTNNNNIHINNSHNFNGNLNAGNKHMQLMQHQQQQQQLQQQEQELSMLTPLQQQQLVMEKKNQEVELYSKRVRFTSGCNGIFSRRLDFSSFNLLPKTRLNSYQVKIEDEGNHGNDETRLFILSSLAQSQKSRVACILCEAPMFVFDRYPLVEGSFFLSPKQHSPGCIEVKHEGRAQFLTAVCMGCLNGNSCNRAIYCRFCGDRWNGSSLVLGTMYSYDIFAAMPCCAERLKCNACFKLLLHPQQRLNFYSDYSHCVACPYCNTQDAHFVKPIAYCYTKQAGKLSQQLP